MGKSDVKRRWRALPRRLPREVLDSREVSQTDSGVVEVQWTYFLGGSSTGTPLRDEFANAEAGPRQHCCFHRARQFTGVITGMREGLRPCGIYWDEE